jgi:flagellar assembly factor FliW
VKINTKNFGEIEIEESKLIIFEKGIIGYPDLNRFALIHDEEQGDNAGIRWLQSMEEPTFALPVMDPLIVKEGYNPKVDDELLKPLQINNTDDMLVLVTVTVPKDIKELSVNLCGPIVINAEKRLGAQMIVENEEYPVRFPIYALLKNKKEAGE